MKFAVENEKIDGELTDLPLRNILPPSQDNPIRNQKYFDLPPKPKISKIQLNLTLTEGANCALERRT